MQAKHHFRRTVAGTTFTATADVEGCAKCAELHIPASLMIGFERAIAVELARRGPVSDETFRWIRKSAALERGDLAQILGVTPETIAGWESERRPIDRAAWLLVAAMVLDGFEGPRALRTRIRAQQRKAQAPAETALELLPAGMNARVLTLLTGPVILTDADIADALDVDPVALRARLRDFAALGLVKPLDDSETEPQQWAPCVRHPTELLRAAVNAGVDLDSPLPRAVHGHMQAHDVRPRAPSSM